MNAYGSQSNNLIIKRLVFYTDVKTVAGQLPAQCGNPPKQAALQNDQRGRPSSICCLKAAAP